MEVTLELSQLSYLGWEGMNPVTCAWATCLDEVPNF